MVKALFDTNILIAYLNAVPDADAELARYGEKAVSIITWIEVLVGAPPAVEAATRAFLDDFRIVPLDGPVAERAVALRKQYKVKLPDAVVWASAEVHSMLLVTRDRKDFSDDMPGIRIPYRL